MRFFHVLGRFADAILHRSRQTSETEEELRSHIEHRADDLERSGVPRREAMRRAAVEFGGFVRFKEESQKELGKQFLENLLRDVHFGLRILRKSPGFTGTAILTLALAIGANAIVFSVLNGLVLRPLDVPEAGRFYTVERGNDASPQQSYLDYLDLRDRNRAFDGMVAFTIAPVGFDSGSGASSSWLFEASGNYFDVLGVQPYLGRFFHSSDEHGFNGSPYIVLTYGFWRSHFQGDPNVVGRMVQVNKHPYTILGVAPREFHGTELLFGADFWVPILNQEEIEGYNQLKSRANRGMYILGKAKAEVTPEQAAADLNSVGAYLAKSYPIEDAGANFTVAHPGLLGDMLGRPVRGFLMGITLLAALILLAACANLGSLFAARAADRSREIALRLALGSSRKRILRQLLTEAVMVSLLGGASGLFAAVGLLRWLSVWQPVSNFPIRLPVNPDANVYTVALLLALVSGILFGLVPVRQVLQVNPWQTVKAGPASAVERKISFRDLMLVVQVIVCAVLVTASLVAVQGMIRSLHSNLGFQPENVVLANTDLDMADYRGDRVALMQRRLLETVEELPGVTSAGLIDRMPLGLDWGTSVIFKDDATDLKASSAAAESMQFSASPGYFRAAGTELLTGRSFTVHDDASAPRVAVVNREFARHIFGSVESAIGGHYKLLGGDRIQVIGVVEDGKYKTLTEDPQPAMFFPILQAPTSATWLVLRSNRDAQSLAAVLESTLHGLDPGLPFQIKTWHKELDSAMFAPRAATVSLGMLGGMGAMLAITGVFGMASYSVSKRLRELGIRIALGAQRREVLWVALGRTIRLMAIGSAVGLLLGAAATQMLSFVVYQATSRDPLVLGGVVVAMLLLGLIATWIPASRALRADPLALLREE